MKSNRDQSPIATGLGALCKQTVFVVAAIASAVITAAAPARAQPCTPIRIESDASALPAAWRRSLDALVAATGQAGQPWSCTGGAASLSFDPATGVGRLTIVDADGFEVVREIRDPEEIAPTGKALLAVPSPSYDPAERSPGAPSPDARVEAAADRLSPSDAKPLRASVAALTGLRYSGPDPTGWTGGELRGDLRFRQWLVGIWGHVEIPLDEPAISPRHYELLSYGAGLRAGRTLATGPIEWSLTFNPSVAAVEMEVERGGDGTVPTSLHHEATHAALWLGSSLGATWRMTHTLAAVVSVDGEIAPADIGAPRPADPLLVGMPEYRAGLALGLEARLR